MSLPLLFCMRVNWVTVVVHPSIVVTYNIEKLLNIKLCYVILPYYLCVHSNNVDE